MLTAVKQHASAIPYSYGNEKERCSSLEIAEARLGKDHPSVAATLTNLGSVLSDARTQWINTFWDPNIAEYLVPRLRQTTRKVSASLSSETLRRSVRAVLLSLRGRLTAVRLFCRSPRGSKIYCIGGTLASCRGSSKKGCSQETWTHKRQVAAPRPRHAEYSSCLPP